MSIGNLTVHWETISDLIDNRWKEQISRFESRYLKKIKINISKSRYIWFKQKKKKDESL